MSTAEQLAFSISVERGSVHILLWDDKHDLVRALLVLFAGLEDLRTHGLLVSDDEKDLRALRQLVETRIPPTEDDLQSDQDSESFQNQLWLLFVQQASCNAVGPWLNGWRRPVSEPPGAMLVIRHADFAPFQRNAPDVASFVGPRVYDASTMLSVFSGTTYARLRHHLPDEIELTLNRLPGASPAEQEVADWIRASAPDEA